MALDEALLERAERLGEAWLRLYGWEPACVSLGRHEPARRYDRGAIAARGLDVVRRPTGGRAVWHEGELTYAVAAPLARLGSPREAYAEIHRLLRDALWRLGAPAELAPAPSGDRGVGAGPCFASSAGGEVTVGGAKVVGSAQLRRDGALLQHGSVLLAEGQGRLAGVAVGAAPHDRSLPLARALGRAVSWQEAATAVVDAAARRWPGCRPARPPTGLLAAGERGAARFRSAEWTWAR